MLCEYSKRLGASPTTDADLVARLNVCDTLLHKNERIQFFDNIVTGDEQWIVYNDVSKKGRANARVFYLLFIYLFIYTCWRSGAIARLVHKKSLCK
jgi:hypothetical protein